MMWGRVGYYGPRGGRRRLSWGETAALASNDGFRSTGELFYFFETNHGLPFEGLLIRWGDITPAADGWEGS